MVPKAFNFGVNVGKYTSNLRQHAGKLRGNSVELVTRMRTKKSERKPWKLSFYAMENAELNCRIPTDVISIRRFLYRHVEPYDCHVVSSSLMDTSVMIDHDRVTLPLTTRISILPVLFSHFSRVALILDSSTAAQRRRHKEILGQLLHRPVGKFYGSPGLLPVHSDTFHFGPWHPWICYDPGIGRPIWDHERTTSRSTISGGFTGGNNIKPFHQIQAAKEMRWTRIDRASRTWYWLCFLMHL